MQIMPSTRYAQMRLSGGVHAPHDVTTYDYS